MIDLKTLFQVPCVDAYNGFDISSDGRKIAYSWNKAGQWDIYELALNSRRSPRRISIGAGGKFCPQYSPDGTRLAYLVDYDGSERYHLVVQDFISGKVTDLTPRIEYSLQTSISWAPDGNAIAFLADRNLHYEAFIMDLRKPVSGESDSKTLFYIRSILDVGRPGWQLKWSPEGKYLAVVYEGPGQDYLTYLVTADGIENHLITDGKQTIDARNPAWSPDGKKIAFSSNESGWQSIGILDLETKSIEWLKNNQVERYSPAWSPDGKNLTYVTANGAETWLELYRMGEHPLRIQQMEPGLHFSPTFTPDGESIIFIYDNPRHPDDIWQISFRERSLKQLTHSLPPSMSNTDFIMPDEVIFPSLDGETVPALLFRPTELKTIQPAVIIIHGGPTWHFSFTWYPFICHMVSRGWVVLAPNYRGSTGYGRQWQMANRFDLGGGDTDDCAAGALYLVREGLADPTKIAVTGRSHGGYLTMSCLTRHPKLWACGSAIVPFLNLFNCHEELREDLRHWDIENMGNPEENYELWHDRSPYYFLDKVCVPVQIICGENDPRCPPKDSIAARDKLLEYGQPVDFKMYKDEGHSFLKLENVIDSENRRIEFIAKYLEK